MSIRSTAAKELRRGKHYYANDAEFADYTGCGFLSPTRPAGVGKRGKTMHPWHDMQD